MEKDLTKCLAIYKEQLENKSIQIAYIALMEYMAQLKNEFSKDYYTSNLSRGYLDYTYFPFSNSYLKARKLRFGIILNHELLRIELWLMGQNSTIQKKYWEVLKDTKWNQNQKSMPKYSVLEASLFENIDFNNENEMTNIILERANFLANEIQEYLKDNDI